LATQRPNERERERSWRRTEEEETVVVGNTWLEMDKKRFNLILNLTTQHHKLYTQFK
jgi:hypothetical protein